MATEEYELSFNVEDIIMKNEDDETLKDVKNTVKREIKLESKGSDSTELKLLREFAHDRNEKKKLMSRIEYYNKLIEKVGGESQLTPSQQKKYNEYKLKAKELNINITPKPKLSAEEKKEMNKQKARERYQKMRQSPEWVKHFNEYQRNRYHQKKLEREAQNKAEATETLKTLGSNKKAKINKINIENESFEE